MGGRAPADVQRSMDDEMEGDMNEEASLLDLDDYDAFEKAITSVAQSLFDGGHDHEDLISAATLIIQDIAPMGDEAEMMQKATRCPEQLHRLKKSVLKFLKSQRCLLTLL
jgi:hypothetical protein